MADLKKIRTDVAASFQSTEIISLWGRKRK